MGENKRRATSHRPRGKVTDEGQANQVSVSLNMIDKRYLQSMSPLIRVSPI